MADLADKLPSWATPQLLLSGCNFIAIVFGVGMVWQSTTGDVISNKKSIEDLKIEARASISDLKGEVVQLRAQNTSIAVLQANVTSIRESVARIEGRLEKVTPAK